MEPIWGLILTLIFASLAAYTAHRRGRNAFLWGALPLMGSFFAALFLGAATHNGFIMGIAFIGIPSIAFVGALTSRSAATLVAEGHVVNGYKKCPFCAESVRVEAIKCKHCGSTIGKAASSDPLHIAESER
jgi:hypothetical protein